MSDEEDAPTIARPSRPDPDEADPSSITRIDVVPAAVLEEENVEDLVTQTQLPANTNANGPHSSVTRQLEKPIEPAEMLDDEDATRMGKLESDQVRAAFAAAEAQEAALEPIRQDDVVEMDSDELESEPEIDDLEKTGTSLPRFTLEEPVPDPEDGSDDAPTGTRLSRPAIGSIPVVEPTRTPASEEEIDVSSGEAEIVGDEDAGPTETEARAPVVPLPKGPTFVPPAPVGRPLAPAYALDPDPDEKQLQDEGSFDALVELYRLRLPEAATRTSKVALHHKIASVHERLGDAEAAWSELLTAFEIDPTDDAIVDSIDRVGKREGRIGEVVQYAQKALHTADPEARIALLGHLVFWYERMLGRAPEASRFIAEIERLDKSHPVILERAAVQAAQTGDAKLGRDLLVRALDRTARREKKVLLHIALAHTYPGGPDAAKHYEAALAIDPASTVALQGLERIGRLQEKYPQVEWALERLVETAQTASEKVDALLKLAELQESKFLRRERAAEMLEKVLEIEPANPNALKGLERCYHALREWPKLARILRTRAENTYDKKTQAELLELAAEVYESKLGDPTQAIEVYRDLLHADPKHRRALADLGRLYEKIGDWGNVATFRARLAELASSKRQASRELVQLGDFLNTPERDSIAARLQYERAASIDPSNASAWEALQRLAEAEGDDRKVIHCLEQRAQHIDGPRQRAAVLVELARFHERRGDLGDAREAWSGAVAIDGTNEAAAIVMLDAFAREERWKEAAPLCELLVNAAIRDKDPEALFTRLRLQTRISAALGDADKAMSAAIAALEARPDDPDAQSDLVVVCAQCREVPNVIARAKEWLARIAAGPVALPPDALVRLGVLQRDAGEPEAAAATLERARELNPDDAEAQRELCETYIALHDWPHASKLLIDLARNATTAEEQFRLLVQAGEMWQKNAGEPEKAASIFEEARSIKPHDHWVLHALMGIYGEIGKWDRLSNVLEAIVQIQESPERKAKSLFAMAVVVREKMGDAQRAADIFDQVLDVDRKKLEAFEEIVRTLTAVKDWEALERAYRRMLGRIQSDDEPLLKFALFQQLGIVYRDRLEDAPRAYEAFDAASRLNPDDADVRRMVVELLVVSDELDSAVSRIRELVDRNPHDAELFAELYDLFLRQHYFDKAWCAVNVLATLRELTPDQRRFLDDYAPMPLHEVPGQIVEQAWASHVFHVDLDPVLTELFAIMTPAVARMRHAQLPPHLSVGRPFTPQHSRWYDPLVRTFHDAAEILGLTPPELLLGDSGSPIAIQPALAPYGALLVSVPAMEASVDSLVYLVGKRLAEQRPELTARAFFPSVPDLTSLLAAAVRVSKQQGAMDPASQALDASFVQMMTHDEREGIRSIVLEAAMEGGLVDVKRWSQAADLSSMRAGLLLCGDVEPVRRFILAEPVSAADLPPRERIGELYKFATSDLYSDLRGAIGVVVQS